MSIKGLVGRDAEKKARMISLELLLVFALATIGLLGVAFIGVQMIDEQDEEAKSFERQLGTLAGPDD